MEDCVVLITVRYIWGDYTCCQMFVPVASAPSFQCSPWHSQQQYLVVGPLSLWTEVGRCHDPWGSGH